MRASLLGFGLLELEQSQVLFRSALGSMVVSNLSPVLPNHLVVLPKRPVALFRELEIPEVTDLFETVKQAQNIAIERNCLHKGDETSTTTTAFNLSMMDGRPGQVLPHFFVHVVPRQPNDLPPDMIHQLIETWVPPSSSVQCLKDSDNNSATLLPPPPPPLKLMPDSERRPRTKEEMMTEARQYAEISSHLFSSCGSSTGCGGVNSGAGGACEVEAEVSTECIDSGEEVWFSKFKIDPSQIFYTSKSNLSIGLVNLKPLVPGHVLVIPRRVVARLQDLTEEETNDLWLSVREVQQVVTSYHKTNGSQLGVQDGFDAGQSVPHVHVHILPTPTA
jgi:diadenosine tetraphosphate (Ap4A) HIT family hydrolase